MSLIDSVLREILEKYSQSKWLREEKTEESWHLCIVESAWHEVEQLAIQLECKSKEG
tara:strand:+ start:141 stop:311 length:171 start_codon:yes stop_codon:yes gene_type:complete